MAIHLLIRSLFFFIRINHNYNSYAPLPLQNENETNYVQNENGIDYVQNENEVNYFQNENEADQLQNENEIDSLLQEVFSAVDSERDFQTRPARCMLASDMEPEQYLNQHSDQHIEENIDYKKWHQPNFAPRKSNDIRDSGSKEWNESNKEWSNNESSSDSGSESSSDSGSDSNDSSSEDEGVEIEGDDDDDAQTSCFSTSTNQRKKIERRSPRQTIPKRTSSAVVLKTFKPLTKEIAKSKKALGKLMGKPPSFKYVYKKPKRLDTFVDMVENIYFDEFGAHTDQELHYRADLGLVSIRSVMDGLAKVQKYPYSTTMIQTKAGQALKGLSQYIKRCEYFRQIVNNATLTPSVYALVYGAVPDVAAVEFLPYYLSMRYKTKSVDEIRYIPEGELEIACYAYTMLSSSDLLNWKSDTNRSSLKALLVHACAMIPVTETRLQISAYIDASDTKYITAECMLLIKRDYSDIIAAIRTIENPEEKAKRIGVWHAFMSKCKVHHFCCPHTASLLVKKGIDFIGKGLVERFNDLSLETADHDLFGVKYTLEDTKMMFNFVPMIQTSTRVAMKEVQKIVSSVTNHLAKMFGDHVVDYGIFPTTCKINQDHVSGFAKRYSNMISQNNFAVFPTITNKSTSIEQVVALRAQMRCDFAIDTPLKMDKPTAQLLLEVINLIILKHVQVLMFADPPNERCRGEMLYSVLQELLESPEFTSFDNMEAWSRLDDDQHSFDKNEKKKKKNASNNEADDSENELVYSGDEDADCDDYQNSAKDELLTLNLDSYTSAEPFQKPPKPVKTGTPPKAAGAKYKELSELTPYKLQERVLSRVQCVMCKVGRATKGIFIDEDIDVSCCMKCYGVLTNDYLDEKKIDHDAIKYRIRQQFKTPVAFLSGSFIETCDFDKTVARASYNRKAETRYEAKSKPRKRTSVEKSTGSPPKKMPRAKKTSAARGPKQGRICSKEIIEDDNDSC